MSKSSSRKLSPSEARKLSRFLASDAAPSGSLSFTQLKGFLFSICTTPDLISPSMWLPAAFGGAPPKLEADMISLIIRLHQQINDEVIAGNPKLPSNCTLNPKASQNFKPGSGLFEWCSGFECGLALTIESWDQIPLEVFELDGEIESYWFILGFFADEKRARSARDEQVSPPFSVLVEMMRDQLPWLMKDYARISRTFFEAQFADATEFESFLPEVEKDSSSNVVPLFKPKEPNLPDIAPEQLLEAAYECRSIEEAVVLAQAALAKDPNLVDAYLLLADCEAHNKQRYFRYLQKAVQAGEAGLGEDFIKQHEGQFWDLPNTRPYMIALGALANAYAQDRKLSPAISLLERALELNPSDNPGNRHLLISLYLQAQRLPQAESLLQRYKQDDSAFMRFSRVLLAYIQNGDSTKARRLREAAMRYNPMVAKYLSGQRRLPIDPPANFTHGDKNEAILYAQINRPLWQQVMGSVKWLSEKNKVARH